MYYTPPEVAREVDPFVVVIANPPFAVTAQVAKTPVIVRIARRLRIMFARCSIVEVQA